MAYEAKDFSTLGASAWRDEECRFMVGTDPTDPTVWQLVDTNVEVGEPGWLVTRGKMPLNGEDPDVDIANAILATSTAGPDIEIPDGLGSLEFQDWARIAQEYARDEVERRVAEHDRQLADVGWRTMSSFEKRRIELMWDPYVAYGYPTTMAGDPGVGKTKVALALAAWRSGLGEHVILLTAEDDPESSLRPFLEKHGANLDFIHTVPTEKMFVLDDAGLSKLDHALATWPIRLVIIDPVVYFMGGRTDMNRQNEVRVLMGELAKRAAAHRLAMLVLMHVNKGGQKALYKLMGSVDFSAAVRSVLIVGQDDHDDARGKAMFHIKCNYAKKGEPRGFVLLDDPDDEYRTPTFQWAMATDLTLADVEGSKPGRKPSQSKMAKQIIVGLLKDGPLDSKLVTAAVLGSGVSEATLRRVREEIVDVEPHAAGPGGGRTSMWKLRPLVSHEQVGLNEDPEHFGSAQ